MAAKLCPLSTDAVDRVTAAVLRRTLHPVYAVDVENGTGRPPYIPPVRAVRLIIFLAAACTAASSTGPWYTHLKFNDRQASHFS